MLAMPAIANGASVPSVGAICPERCERRLHDGVGHDRAGRPRARRRTPGRPRAATQAAARTRRRAVIRLPPEVAGDQRGASAARRGEARGEQLALAEDQHPVHQFDQLDQPRSRASPPPRPATQPRSGPRRCRSWCRRRRRGRVVEQQDLRAGREPARDHHLLLSAAAERGDRVAAVTGRDVHQLGVAVEAALGERPSHEPELAVRRAASPPGSSRGSTVSRRSPSPRRSLGTYAIPAASASAGERSVLGSRHRSGRRPRRRPGELRRGRAGSGPGHGPRARRRRRARRRGSRHRSGCAGARRRTPVARTTTSSRTRSLTRPTPVRISSPASFDARHQLDQAPRVGFARAGASPRCHRNASR